jgi:hypothetical protein
MNNTTTCLAFASVGGGIQIEEKDFERAEEAGRYVRALRRRGRTAWVKGDRRYLKMEAFAK